MYKRFFITLMLSGFLLSACSDQPEDRSAKLKELRKQKQEIEQQIATLEKELAGEGKLKKDSVELMPVSVSVAVPDTFRHFIEVQGRVESDKNIFVTPRAQGAVVTSVLVEEGDKVSKGQVLATLDASAMQQTLQQLQTQYRLTKEVFEKQKNLWDQKIGTELQYLQAKANKESMEKQVAAMREQVENYTLRAPISGVVDDVHIKVGEVPVPGQSGIRVVNPDDVKIKANLSEAHITKVKEGDKVIVDLPDQKVSIYSTVKTTSRVIDATNRTFTIIVDPAKTQKAQLRPNMMAVVKVNDYTNTSIITLPVNAVQKDDAGTFVFVAADEDGKFIVRKKPVVTGIAYGGKIEIMSGLEKGEKVITTGYQNVTEGQAISI